MNKQNDVEIINKLAEAVAAEGGRAYYVGGCVRDAMLGKENKDFDIEVHNIEPQKLRYILETLGTPLEFGQSFGIFTLAGTNIDVAVPRKEETFGRGHRDIEITACPDIGTLGAAKRRDFTVNAMMRDVLSGELTDHFGGEEDLRKGLLRHVDAAHFGEDPLRVLRAARFASVLDFEIDEETIELCRSVDISALSRERIEQEVKLALVKAEHPSVFFESLRKMNQLSYWFRELEQTIGVEQNPKYHPEGDVWVHTMQVIDRAAAYRDKVSDSYSFMLMTLTHDFGKSICSTVDDGVIRSIGHETEGLPLIKDFLDRWVGEKAVKRYVLQMVPIHMRPNVLANARSSVKSTNRLFDDAQAPADIVYFALSDKSISTSEKEFNSDRDFLFERLDVFEEIMSRPYVSGEDLIAAGLEPGEIFREVLEYAHKLRLAGVDKESSLKQSLAFAAGLIKKNRR